MLHLGNARQYFKKEKKKRKEKNVKWSLCCKIFDRNLLKSQI